MGDKNVDIVERWGRLFKRADYGLDEKQIASFVEELIRERDMLLKQQEHLFSLIRLAERATVGADSMAEQSQRGIVGEANGQTRKIIQERKAEAPATASREVEAIKVNAQQQVELLLKEKGKEISPQMRDSIHRLHGELQSQLESFKQQVVTLEAEFERKLSQLSGGTGAVGREADKMRDEFRELMGAMDQSKTGEPEPDWEVQILPPIDIMQALAIMTSLDNFPEMEKTELIPDINKPTIAVFVRKPINLIDMLRTLPQVAMVKEDAADKAGGKPRKIQIVLSEKAISEKGN